MIIPVAIPTAGNYTIPQNITLFTPTTGAAIYYTLDGTEPTINSMLFTSDILIRTNTIIKAVAVKEGIPNSGILTAGYTIRLSGNSQDDQDFGIGTEVTNVFNVASETEWNVALMAISSGGNTKNYIINITADFSINGSLNNTLGSVSGLQVSIRGDRKVTLSSTGSALHILREQNVVIRDIDFIGIAENSAPLVYTEGTLTLRGSTSVSGNTNTAYDFFCGGGGVFVFGGTLTMMDNATVFGNTASSDSTWARGGGVHVFSGTFTLMDSATVSGNTAFSLPYSGGGGFVAQGGGVYVRGGTFTMWDNAVVSGNTATSKGASAGGGVHMDGSPFNISTFTMWDNAMVSDNTVSSDISSSVGGGVYVHDSTFTMRDNAAVSGNTVTPTTIITPSSGRNRAGGGVYVTSSNITDPGAFFTMWDNATVSDNTVVSETVSFGGGVCIGSSNGIFQIEGGTVYGISGGRNANKSGSGAALYGTAQYGVVDESFTLLGSLSTTNDTIKVVNGVLQ